MRKIVLFGEDSGHEKIVGGLTVRVLREEGLDVVLQPRSSAGGHGRMLTEAKQFARRLPRSGAVLPDLLVIAMDANCQGYSKAAGHVTKELADYHGSMLPALPDPHVERWLLLGFQAFRTVLGKGCDAPDKKCRLDRYKQQLDSAVRNAGIEPLLGGMEFADELVAAMDIERTRTLDASLNHFIEGLLAQARQWRT